MATSDARQTDVDTDAQDGAPESRWAMGDDERDNREQIAKTGEPNRDALGNAEGAS